jgi:hypothetical protein
MYKLIVTLLTTFQEQLLKTTQLCEILSALRLELKNYQSEDTDVHPIQKAFWENLIKEANNL